MVVTLEGGRHPGVGPQTGGRMSPLSPSLLVRLGKALRARNEPIDAQALPKRWADLLHHLDEQERLQQSNSARRVQTEKSERTGEQDLSAHK